MNVNNILKEILSIDKDNLFLHYIVERIKDKDYRGLHISQHNRYDLDRLSGIVEAIHSVVGNSKFRIPLGDDDGTRERDCVQYYEIVKKVKSSIGIGTVNSIKKNFFVDFQRMGFLDRYDKNENLLDIGTRGQIFYCGLTKKATEFATTRSISIKYKVFTDALDVLFQDQITQLAETLYYSNYKNDPIGIYEFMFILSDDRKGVPKEFKIVLIDSYRSLKRWQQNKAIDLIKLYCNPVNFSGSKTDDRDFHNWKNESQQIFSLLKNTVYFEITRNSLTLNTGRYGLFSDVRVQLRSLGAKQEYFVKHSIKRSISFELHHIVPFNAARNKEELKMIDHWKNLLYLEKNKHAEIGKNGNRNMILNITENEIDLEDFDHNFIHAENGKNVKYKGDLAGGMKNYNRELLKDIYEYLVKY
ncbi:MAG: hypothetical protein ABI643_01545 [Candidatus Doudnabacteria bacterium]